MTEPPSPMRRSTAVRNLTELAERASHLAEYREVLASPLRELWVAGDILTQVERITRLSIVCVLDMEGAEIPWLSHGGAVPWLEDELRLGKRPLSSCFRALSDPVWNVQDRRLVRFWTADAGLDEDIIQSLSSGGVDGLPIVEAPAAELAGQFRKELAVASRHLAQILDCYWDEDWRRGLKKSFESAEDHLWHAAEAVRELTEALDNV